MANPITPIIEMVKAGKKYLPLRGGRGPRSREAIQQLVGGLTPDIAERVLRERVEDALIAASRTKHGPGAFGRAEAMELRGGTNLFGKEFVTQERLLRDEKAAAAFEQWKQQQAHKRPYQKYSDEGLGRLLGMAEVGLPWESKWRPRTGIEMDIADEFGIPPYFRELAIKELSDRVPKRNTVGAQLQVRSAGLQDILDPSKYPLVHRMGHSDYKRGEPTGIIKGLLSVPDDRANVSLLEALLGEGMGAVHPDIKGVPLHARPVPMKPFTPTPKDSQLWEGLPFSRHDFRVRRLKGEL